jgi:hypothetical protein
MEQVAAARWVERGAGGHRHDGFAAADGKPGHRRFLRHGGGQPQRVVDPFGPAGVPPDPAAADRRAEGGGMDGDDHRQAGARPPADRQFFVFERDHAPIPFPTNGVRASDWIAWTVHNAWAEQMAEISPYIQSVANVVRRSAGPGVQADGSGLRCGPARR